eukprot:6179965-Pleurochrysis_carterae.AAC.2
MPTGSATPTCSVRWRPMRRLRDGCPGGRECRHTAGARCATLCGTVARRWLSGTGRDDRGEGRPGIRMGSTVSRSPTPASPHSARRPISHVATQPYPGPTPLPSHRATRTHAPSRHARRTRPATTGPTGTRMRARRRRGARRHRASRASNRVDTRRGGGRLARGGPRGGRVD